MKGLRLKSAAHIKDFFERTNCGLVVSASCAGVSKDMADLRRRLRNETSAVVPDVRAPASSTQPVVAATKGQGGGPDPPFVTSLASPRRPKASDGALEPPRRECI